MASGGFTAVGPLQESSPLAASDLLGGTSDNDLFTTIDINSTDQSYLSSPDASPDSALWNVSLQSVDPTNTGDTGGVQNTSTPAIAGKNNPETAGSSTSLGGALTAAINAGFASWQLASQPKGTPRTVTAQVGTTRVTSGAGGLSSIFGTTPTGQVNWVPILLIGLVVILILKYR
jgi:hypothetical protein